MGGREATPTVRLKDKGGSAAGQRGSSAAIGVRGASLEAKQGS